MNATRVTLTCAYTAGVSDDGMLPEPVRAWVQREADRYYDGNFGRAVAAILESAWQAEQAPQDPWAGLDTRLKKRRGV